MAESRGAATRSEPGSRAGNSMAVVHGQLRTAILDGTLAEGAVLSQVQLARQFGVSRTPLREALRMLQAEGFIDSVPNQRVRVARFSIEDLDQLYMLRVAIESLAVRVSIARFTAQDFKHLRALIAEMQRYVKAGDVNAWDVPHRAFHVGLAAHAGERVEGVVGQLIDNADRYRRLHYALGDRPQTWRRAATDHKAIVAACERRDADEASALIADHLSRTALALGALIEPDHDPVPVRLALGLFATG